MHVGDDPADRAKKLLVQMTLQEKIDMLYGVQSDYVGTVKENTRLGIPAILMNDGPQGFRSDKYPGTTTAWPCGLGIGTTWDRSLAV